jgi:tRNA (cytidine32/uridine32-2'-O)-methyltransferase
VTSERLLRVRVVLVEPSHPGNIGGAARAMKTMGLADLAVVNPKRFPDPQAQWRAAGAQDVLEAATLFDSVDAAIADCHWVVGTSTRSRRIPWPVKAAEAVAADILAQPPGSQVAVLFGRETNGLSNDELQRCHCHLQIPANPDYPSLNLAMAVQVVCYELYKQAEAVVPELEWDRPPATQAQIERLMGHLQAALSHCGFLDAYNPGQTMTRLRRLFTRVRLDDTEVQMLRGALRQLAPGAMGADGAEDTSGDASPKRDQ